MLDSIGERIKTARLAKSLSGRELGRRAGVSGSLISQIENGQATPSVATLYEIANVLDLSVDDLLGREQFNGPQVTVVKANDRRAIELETGVRWEQLASEHKYGLDFVYLTYVEGASSSPLFQPIQHPGREYAYILSGQLELEVGSETYMLSEGDSVSFMASRPHRFTNRGKGPARAIKFYS